MRANHRAAPSRPRPATAGQQRPSSPTLLRRLTSALPPLVLVGVILGSTVASRAELVVFDTGDVLKVSAYEIEQGNILLELARGGRMRLPIRRIERILDDEIEAPTAPAVPVPQAGFEIGFLDSHPVPSAPYGDLIHDTSRRYRLNPQLVAAMIHAESAFDAQAISPRGARGLLQLMPATAERFGVDPVELDDPARNLEAGARYLRWLADRFDNDLQMVLAAYNSGEGTVDRYRGMPPYRETREYVRRICSALGLQSSPPSAPAL